MAVEWRGMSHCELSVSKRVLIFKLLKRVYFSKGMARHEKQLLNRLVLHSLQQQSSGLVTSLEDEQPLKNLFAGYMKQNCKLKRLLEDKNCLWTLQHILSRLIFYL